MRRFIDALVTASIGPSIVRIATLSAWREAGTTLGGADGTLGWANAVTQISETSTARTKSLVAERIERGAWLDFVSVI